MALKKTIMYKGIEVKNAYVKVKHISGNKDIVSFNAQVYIDKKTSDTNDKDYIYITENFYFIPNISNNLWAQCYLYLKSLDEFADSEDV